MGVIIILQEQFAQKISDVMVRAAEQMLRLNKRNVRVQAPLVLLRGLAVGQHTNHVIVLLKNATQIIQLMQIVTLMRVVLVIVLLGSMVLAEGEDVLLTRGYKQGLVHLQGAI